MGIIQIPRHLNIKNVILVCTVTVGSMLFLSFFNQNTWNAKQYEQNIPPAQRQFLSQFQGQHSIQEFSAQKPFNSKIPPTYHGPPILAQLHDQQRPNSQFLVNKQQFTYQQKSENKTLPSKQKISFKKYATSNKSVADQESPLLQNSLKIKVSDGNHKRPINQERPPEQISDKGNPQPNATELAKMRNFQNYSSKVDESRYGFCNSFKLMPNGSMPLVALMSFPGSGNTWTRALIEYATGIYTGSVYGDWSLYKGGFFGELEDFRDGTTVVVKTHTLRKYKFRKVILLIRNPYNCILTEFNREKGHGHTKHADPSLFKTSNWTEFAKKNSEQWLKKLRTNFESLKPSDVLIVYYESLLADVTEPLEKIVRFLGLPVEKTRLECAKKFSNKRNFHRPHRSLGFDPYDEELTNKIKGSIEKARQLVFQNYHSVLPNYEKAAFS